MTYKKLSEIADIFTGIRTKRYKDIVNGKKTKVLSNNLINGKIEYEEQEIGKINPKFYSQKNDILIHLSNSTNITLIKEEHIIIPLNYAIVRINSENNPEYVYQILKSQQFQKVADRICEGSSIQFLKINDLRNIKIKLLKLEEQEKYGKIMQLLNKRAELNKKRLEIEEKYQNGILQIELGGNYVKL
ncbi:MAG: hypothetical protein E7Z75_10080 [Methanobrevibacter olleyae]|uniref:Type I restriction modification DNA specificity domain-containing protein n=1 Tax=Methanobrevibacter olleyae TaxID=294671 RepID=A0A8T3VYK7_METOL|nr:hypothetical protein [Methanobrevibacter olleyae]